MIELNYDTVRLINRTLLVKGNKTYDVFYGTIMFYVWTSIIRRYVIDGPNWAVEEAESRFN